MKNRDLLTGIGIFAGFTTIVLGILGGGTLRMFWDVPSVIITIGGSFCSLLVNYSFRDIKKLFKVVVQSFKDVQLDSIEIINQFIEISKKARREGLLSLEDKISEIDDNFFKKGLQMVVDGLEPETIREILELEISEMERRHKLGSDMLRAWGGYAPAFGMIGTLIGLIQMLANLTDSSKIASGMAVALITTFYGAVLANVLLNPMAQNLALKSENEAEVRDMMIEGILSIQSGVNPRILEDKLICYLSKEERIKYSQTKTVSNGVTENV
jgi:chemotaxis protein MotA